MALFQKRGQWYIDYYAEGRRVRERVGVSKRLAERALTARRGEITQGRFKLQDVKRSPRFEQVAEEYATWARAHLRSWLRQSGTLRRLRAYFDGRTLREITPWLIERYKQERLKATVGGRRAAPTAPAGRWPAGHAAGAPPRPIRPTTINRELACLKRLFNLAMQWGKAESNPVRVVKFFREDGRRERILSAEEITRLLAACGPRLQAIVLLALHTGMRRGEILGLTWEQVDLNRGGITLTRTKSGKVRKVPMNDVVWATLRALPRTGPYVLSGAQRVSDIKSAWRAACRRADLAGARFHDLRHTWASALVAASVDLRIVQDLGGWCSLGMVERYTHPTAEAKRRAVGALTEVFPARDGHQMDTRALRAVAASAVSQ